jgi:hypothetical protein
MVYGFPYGCPYGNHAWPITFVNLRNILKPNNAPTKDWLLQWIVTTGCDMFWRVAIDGSKVGKPVYCKAGVLQQLMLQIPVGVRLISLCPQGQFGDNNVRIQDQIEAFYEDGRHFPNQFALYIRSDPTLSIGGSTQFSNISATGLRRGVNVAPSKGRPTWGVLDLSLSTDGGGVHTISGTCNGTVMVTGSRTGDGVIVLTGAGAIVTLTLAYTGDFSSGVQLVARWPAKFAVYVKKSVFVDGDFPRDNNGVVMDDGFSNAFLFKSFRLKGGTYYVVSHAIGDDGLEGTGVQGGGQAITVYDVPDPVTGLQYISGGGINTEIGWTPPASDLTVSFNIYDSKDTGALNLVTPAGSNVAGDYIKTLADIGAYTGTRQVVVRSVNAAGVEEPSLNSISIEYVAGVVQQTRPMKPAGGDHFKSNGRTIQVPASVYVDDSILVYPATLEIYLYLKGGAPNYAAPDASVAMPGNSSNAHTMIVNAPVRDGAGNIVHDGDGNIVYDSGIFATVGADGEYYFELGTTAPSGMKSLPGIVYGPVVLTNTAMADPTFVVQEA